MFSYNLHPVASPKTKKLQLSRITAASDRIKSIDKNLGLSNGRRLILLRTILASRTIKTCINFHDWVSTRYLGVESNPDRTGFTLLRPVIGAETTRQPPQSIKCITKTIELLAFSLASLSQANLHAIF